MTATGIFTRSERLEIVHFTDTLIGEEYVGWLNDKELMRFSEQRHRNHSLETCGNYLRSFTGSTNLFLALLLDGQKLVGTMTVYRDVNNGLADIGILVGSPAARGTGLGQEAWNAVCGALEQNYAVRKLTAGAVATNVAMLKIMQNSGFSVDCVRKAHFMIDGEATDVVYMARFPS